MTISVNREQHSELKLNTVSLLGFVLNLFYFAINQGHARFTSHCCDNVSAAIQNRVQELAVHRRDLFPARHGVAI